VVIHGWDFYRIAQRLGFGFNKSGGRSRA